MERQPILQFCWILTFPPFGIFQYSPDAWGAVGTRWTLGRTWPCWACVGPVRLTPGQCMGVVPCVIQRSRSLTALRMSQCSASMWTTPSSTSKWFTSVKVSIHCEVWILYPLPGNERPILNIFYPVKQS